MNNEARKALESLAAGWLVFGIPLSELTTYRLGGPAEALVEPDSLADLAAVRSLIRDLGLDWFTLGGGSNVLVRDGGFDGVIVRLGRTFGDLVAGPEEGGRRWVEAGASVRTPELLALACREGLAGLEFLAGIPGWLGGALAMNAGTREGGVARAAAWIEFMDPDGRVHRIYDDDIRAEYRRLFLPPGAIITRAAFHLVGQDPERVSGRVRDALERRKESQPRGVRCAGCVFRNPAGEFAGRLIDRAGLKGLSEGKAWISEVHANFIVHRGKATAAEILTLIDRARTEVRSRFGVDLETEIVILGRDEPGEEGA
jgi:UDP-N-acetylmuramate dehydrogenase